MNSFSSNRNNEKIIIETTSLPSKGSDFLSKCLYCYFPHVRTKGWVLFSYSVSNVASNIAQRFFLSFVLESIAFAGEQNGRNMR